jgi:putative molybdopterin biosynthesis protein
MSHRRAFLKKMSPARAFEALAAAVSWPDPRPEENVGPDDAVGRTTVRALVALASSPPGPVAAMDGIAVRAADTDGASEARPIVLAGEHCEVIDTGDPLPPWADAVIMIEHAAEVEPGRFEILAPTPPWRHVRVLGEDVVQGDVVLPRGRTLGPFDVGALLAAGYATIPVVRRPVVGLLPTGDELVEPGPSAKPGDVIESNTRVLAGMLAGWGAAPRRYPPCKDDRAALRAAIEKMLAECDAVVVNAGSSAGRDDWTAPLFEEMGTLVAHGIEVMPGKPTALGVVGGKPVFGLPGYPVSTVVAAERVLKPWVERWLGVREPPRPRLRARLGRKIASRPGNEEVVRVVVGRVGDVYRASPLHRGAGVISSLARASGIVSIPAVSEGYEAGAEVEVELLRPREELDLAVVVVGSHDLLLDVCADLLRAEDPRLSLASAHVGSLGGLVALARGECHLAGSHLLDPKTGRYTTPYLAEHVGGVAVRIFHLAMRRQGLIVKAGNPKGIRTWTDLARSDVVYVNRQKGAGTRVLLDARLASAGVAASAIRGYAREEPTHMAVAAAVKGGVADVGLGIEAAARHLGLDFVGLENEPFDLVVAEAHLTHPGVAALLALLPTASFRRAAATFPGYDASKSGEERPAADG